MYIIICMYMVAFCFFLGIIYQLIYESSEGVLTGFFEDFGEHLRIFIWGLSSPFTAVGQLDWIYFGS